MSQNMFMQYLNETRSCQLCCPCPIPSGFDLSGAHPQARYAPLLKDEDGGWRMDDGRGPIIAQKEIN